MPNYIQIRLRVEDAEELSKLSSSVALVTGNKSPSKPDIIRFLINEFRKMKQTTHDIGRVGEDIVLSLLDGSERVSGQPYDILWNDIKIDVKTTTKISNNGQVRFSIPGNDRRHNGILLVCVFIGVTGRKLFIDRYRVDKKTAFYLKDAIFEDIFEEVLLDWNNKSVEIIPVDDTNGKKIIQISDELHEQIMSLKEPYKNTLKKTLRGIKITIPLVIAAGLHLLEKELEKMHTIKTVLMRTWKEYQCDCGFVGTTTKETLAHVRKDQK